jgi:hypothetical protein
MANLNFKNGYVTDEVTNTSLSIPRSDRLLEIVMTYIKRSYRTFKSKVDNNGNTIFIIRDNGHSGYTIIVITKENVIFSGNAYQSGQPVDLSLSDTFISLKKAGKDLYPTLINSFGH